jgi:hypothetical protein
MDGRMQDRSARRRLFSRVILLIPSLVFFFSFGFTANAQNARPGRGAISAQDLTRLISPADSGSDAADQVCARYATGAVVSAPPELHKLIIHFQNDLPAFSASSASDNMAGMKMTLSANDSGAAGACNGAMGAKMLPAAESNDANIPAWDLSINDVPVTYPSYTAATDSSQYQCSVNVSITVQ